MRYFVPMIKGVAGGGLYLHYELIHPNYIGSDWQNIVSEKEIDLLQFIQYEIFYHQFITRNLAQARINSIIRLLKQGI